MRHLAVGVLLSLACSAEDQVAPGETSDQAEPGQTLEQEVQAVFDRMQDLYDYDPNMGSSDVFDDLWLDADNLAYLSEQFDQAMYGREAVAAYFKPAWNILYGYREQYSDLQVTPLSDNVAFATVTINYDMHAVTRTPLGGVTRGGFMLRRTDGGWKIQQFYEMPMNLIEQARLIHERALDADFHRFVRTQNPRYEELVADDAMIAFRKVAQPWQPGPRFRPPTWERRSLLQHESEGN